MKTHLKIFMLGVSMMLPNAYAQEGTVQANTERSEALASVETATQALKESAAKGDKKATLELLAEACKAFPASADTFVALLIEVFTQINVNSSTGTSQEGTSKASDISPVLVGEIVATAIKAAPGFQIAIAATAIQVAPKAVSQITAAANSPLTFTATRGSAGNGTGLTNTPPNTPTKPASPTK